jgi:hypothetical protein
MTPNHTPQIMPTTPLHERVLRWMNDTALGQSFFHWYGKTRGSLQLRRRADRCRRFPHWHFGQALGEPGNVNQQRTVLRELFSLARVAPSPGLVVELPYQWKRQTYPPVVDWTTESKAFTQALARALQTE